MIYGLGEFVSKSIGDDGTFEAVISGIKTDRYGDTINPEGWELKNFKKNPVLLWAHDHYTPTVGRALKVWTEGKNLMMKGEFAPTPFAQELKMLAEQGFLKAFSVGFMPIDYKFNDNGVDFLSQELLEVSFVNVPAYAEALMKKVGENKNNFKNFMKSTEGTMNWEKLIADDGRATLLQEKQGCAKIKEKKVEEEKVEFTKSEFEEFKKELEEKSGKVLSKKNRELIQSAVSVLQELLDATTEDDDKSIKDKEKNNNPNLNKATIATGEKVSKEDLVRIAGKAIEAYLIKARQEKAEQKK